MAEILPDWVRKHKKKNVEIRKIKDRYYAYKIGSVWDKRKKRAKKVTLSYLGTITQKGILPAKHKREQNINAILEYGNIQFVQKFTRKLAPLLAKTYPYVHESIMAAAIIRLCYTPALKNFSFHYQTSYLKYFYPQASLSPRTLSELLHAIGINYGTVIKFFRELSEGKQHIAIDLTTIFSDSENITWAEKGYNSKHINHNQLQLLLLYSLDQRVPSFLKLLPGSISDVSTLTNAIDESNIKNTILIGDRGFYSKNNVKVLDKNLLRYILPLSRTIKEFVHYEKDEAYKEFFKFRDRFIWFNEYSYKDKRIVQFLDKKLRQEEETNFLENIEKEKKNMDDYHRTKAQFGVMSIITNTDLSPKEIYYLYKKRVEIEVAFDIWKNNLESDKTYMRSNEHIRGYFFITFLSLHLYCQIINHLRAKDLLKKYSVQDVLLLLSKIYSIRLGTKEITAEIPKRTRTLLTKLELPIT